MPSRDAFEDVLAVVVLEWCSVLSHPHRCRAARRSSRIRPEMLLIGIYVWFVVVPAQYEQPYRLAVG